MTLRKLMRTIQRTPGSEKLTQEQQVAAAMELGRLLKYSHSELRRAA